MYSISTIRNSIVLKYRKEIIVHVLRTHV